MLNTAKMVIHNTKTNVMSYNGEDLVMGKLDIYSK